MRRGMLLPGIKKRGTDLWAVPRNFCGQKCPRHMLLQQRTVAVFVFRRDDDGGGDAIARFE
jgi:hypothetical protein